MRKTFSTIQKFQQGMELNSSLTVVIPITNRQQKYLFKD